MSKDKHTPPAPPKLTLVDKSQQRDDLVQPFVAATLGLRGRFIRLGAVVQTILSRHDYPQAVARQLGELLVLTATVGGLLKGKGQVTVQVKGDGLINFLVADCASDGTLRGYADLAEGTEETLANLPEDAETASLLGKGYLAITLDYHERYQGIVELQQGQSLTQAVQRYFAQSEQFAVHLRTFFEHVTFDDAQAHWMGAAILVQKMPQMGGKKLNNHDKMPIPGTETGEQETRDEAWERVATFLDTLTLEEMLGTELDAGEVLYRLFHQDGLEVFPPSRLHAGCRCSRERILDVLTHMGQEQREYMYQNGVIEVVCQFCKGAEHFVPEDFPR